MITSIRHPIYNTEFLNWAEWRLTYEGGWAFVNSYLERFSDKESDTEFARRKRLTPVPAFAKAAVDEIKNSIFQRMRDITRGDGPDSYQIAVTGANGGVDLHGSSMNYFMGEYVLLELLIMGRVGIFTDAPPQGLTAADAGVPYVYKYATEDILSWTYHPQRREEFSSVLLRDYNTITSVDAGLPNDIIESFRLLTLTDGGVKVEFFSKQVDPGSEADVKEAKTGEQFLNLSRIPFTLLTLPHSIISDITRHQIALLNMESSDIMYSIDANFPTYTEQRQIRDFSHYHKPTSDEDDPSITLGPKRVRYYAQSLDRPEYIAPPTDSLNASMAKQEQLKKDLRELVHLSIASLSRLSAESKEIDQQGLEAGLSQIGSVLEFGERKVAEFWAEYENAQPAYISYPARYDLRSELDRQKEADNLIAIRPAVVSKTFQNQITYRIAEAVIGHKTSSETMAKIEAEIEAADAYSGDIKTIIEAIDAGVLDSVTAAKLLGYPVSVVEKAQQEHVDRLARIQASQSAARGVSDAAANPLAAPTEKVGKPGRGEGKFNNPSPAG